MTRYGYDLSKWQGPDFNHRKARDEGHEFCILRCWDRDVGGADPTFHSNLVKARNADLLVAAYHFLTPWHDAHQNAQQVRDVVPTDMPVILDVEKDQAGRGQVDIGMANAVATLLRKSGYSLPLAYVPHWYWDGYLKRPNLDGLADRGLWASRYAPDDGGWPAQIYRNHIPAGWNSYGGMEVKILQFTNKATVGGHSPVDANAFEGSRAELEQIFGGTEDMFSNSDRMKLNQALKEITGSYKGWEFPGFPTFLDDDNTYTTVDFIRWADRDSYRLAGIEGGQEAALKEIVKALKNGESVDRESLLAAVREGTRSALKEYSRSVNVTVTDPEDDHPSGGQ